MNKKYIQRDNWHKNEEIIYRKKVHKKIYIKKTIT